MPSGGARTRSGPPPDPLALRRDRPSDKSEWIDLPATGRAGDPPAWPLTRPTAREKFHWSRLWALPQGVAWEASFLTDAVASYVRCLGVAEQSDAKAADRTLARQYQDTLGLTDAGMRANRWRIVSDAPAPTRTNDANRAATKASLRAIVGGAA